MKTSFFNRIRNQHELIFKLLLLLVSVVIIVFLLPKEGKFKYEFQKNKPWVHEDLLAPFDFAINKTNEEIEQEKTLLSDEKTLYFKFDFSVVDSAEYAVSSWVRDNWNDSIDVAGQDVAKAVALNYLDSIYKTGVIELVDELEGKNEDYNVQILSETNIGEEEELGRFFTIKSAYDFVVADLEHNNHPRPDFIASIIENCLFQNLVFDADLTQTDFETNIANISYSKGGVFEQEKIISKGELVDGDRFAMLQSLKDEYESKLDKNQSYWLIIGQTLLVLLLFYAMYIFIKNTKPEVFNNNMDIGFISLVVVGFVAITTLVLSFEGISVYVIPYCIIPLLIRTFFGNRLALFVYIIAIFLISFIVPNPFEFIFLEALTGIVTLYTVLNVNKRAELFYTAIIIFVVIALSYTGLALFQGAKLESIDVDKLTWFGIASGLTLLTYPLIYMFEKLFGYISDVTLLELADTNNKLLKELNLKAPGTFQHSLQVSNLAEEAIQEIGGNPLLVRTGALYHDIGKMLAPAYFIENQNTGINPHDELSYEESAEIIINHVVRGIELAKEYNLPEQIIDFIRTHHGTTKTQYFLRMFEKENPDLEVDDSIFQYPGPIPYSKETAVLMMADSVEAASRSLKIYDNDSISALVNGIIDGQVNQGQFENTNITFNDVTNIKKMFIKKLMNIYHVRIEYPK
jgi:putative nucleotidyltransferase with HDIG domain